MEYTDPEASRELSMYLFDNPLGAIPVESEDCLYINVYAPASEPPPEGRAVMYWIYGGSLDSGTANMLVYNGSSFAAYQDVIIVSANYRINGECAEYSEIFDALSLLDRSFWLPELSRASFG